MWSPAAPFDRIGAVRHAPAMSRADLLQLLHVFAAFGFVAGLVGRDTILAAARRSDDLGQIHTLLRASAPLERILVVPGSLVVLVLGILTWWAEALPVWGAGTRWVTVSLLAFLTIVPLVPLVFLPRGKVFDAAMASADEAGRVTPELSSAFHDPVVAAARWYELAVVAFVIALMVTKPF
jgi:Predicted integral membrane protein (DUF2269)